MTSVSSIAPLPDVPNMESWPRKRRRGIPSFRAFDTCALSVVGGVDVYHTDLYE